MPGGIGDTVSGGGLSVVAVIAIAAVLGALAFVISQSSTLRRLFDRFCGHTQDIPVDTSGAPGDPTRPAAAGWPGFDPSFYGPSAGVDHHDLDATSPGTGPGL